MYDDYEDRDDVIDGVEFARPGSALRAPTKRKPAQSAVPDLRAQECAHAARRCALLPA